MFDLAAIQSAIREEGFDGWLFFDHHHRDPLAYRVLGLTLPGLVSRRWYYFIPASGEPSKLVHKIESFHLDTLPGSKVAYAGWEQQKQSLCKMFGGARRIAVQYSPDCAIPYVSMVDGGTLELIRSCGVEVFSSANLIQYFEARLNDSQFESHVEAGKLVDEIRREAFRLIGDRICSQSPLTEWEVQQFISQQFKAHGLHADHGPNCSVNGNASNPHYEPQQDSSASIQSGDIVLIDLWAKFNRPDAVYYDVTWMGFCGPIPPSSLENVFGIVSGGRNRAIEIVQNTIRAGDQLAGYQVDDAARTYIREQGYEEYFFHRTGHSIGTEVHGSGANMDNLETHDDRRVIAGTCFSIEPGIYLPEFGVRSEVNMFIHASSAQVTGEIQQSVVRI